MASRTVRLDEQAEAALRQVRKTTGLPISAALTRGLYALQEQVSRKTARAPYEIYRELDLGPGGYAIASSTDVRRGVTQALRKKHHR